MRGSAHVAESARVAESRWVRVPLSPPLPYFLNTYSSFRLGVQRNRETPSCVSTGNRLLAADY
jgi:hypothetical protein